MRACVREPRRARVEPFGHPAHEAKAHEACLPAHDRYASLHELELRGNPISDDLHVACMEQLLLNNLPRLYDRSLRAARDAKAADGSDGVGGKSPARKGKSRRALDEDKDVCDSLDASATPHMREPLVSLSLEWLSDARASALRQELQRSETASLVLERCARLKGAGLGALLAPPASASASASALRSLVHLRAGGCEVDDAFVVPLATAVSHGALPNLRTLALESNRIRLESARAPSFGLPPPGSGRALAATDAILSGVGVLTDEMRAKGVATSTDEAEGLATRLGMALGGPRG